MILSDQITITEPEKINDFIKSLSLPFDAQEKDYILLLLIEKDITENITTVYYNLTGSGAEKHNFKLHEVNHFVAEQWIKSKGYQLEFTPEGTR